MSTSIFAITKERTRIPVSNILYSSSPVITTCTYKCVRGDTSVYAINCASNMCVESSNLYAATTIPEI